MDSPDSPVFVSNLRKDYGNTPVVKGVDLEVSAGEVFALLGPNGAGKSTTVEILEGVRQRSSGTCGSSAVIRPRTAARGEPGSASFRSRPAPTPT